MICGRNWIRWDNRSYSTLIFSRRVNGSGQSANAFNLVHLFYWYEIQITVAKRYTVSTCIGNISGARHFKSWSGICINNRAQTEHKNESKCESFAHCDHNRTGRWDLRYLSEQSLIWRSLMSATTTGEKEACTYRCVVWNDREGNHTRAGYSPRCWSETPSSSSNGSELKNSKRLAFQPSGTWCFVQHPTIAWKSRKVCSATHLKKHQLEESKTVLCHPAIHQ